MEEKIRLAVFGQKRLSREGGIEIVVKELCIRMAQNGCDVTCYNRAGHHVSGAEYDKTIEYDGIRQKVVPTIEKKGLAAVSSSFFAALCSAYITKEQFYAFPCNMREGENKISIRKSYKKPNPLAKHIVCTCGHALCWHKDKRTGEELFYCRYCRAHKENGKNLKVPAATIYKKVMDALELEHLEEEKLAAAIQQGAGKKAIEVVRAEKSLQMKSILAELNMEQFRRVPLYESYMANEIIEEQYHAELMDYEEAHRKLNEQLTAIMEDTLVWERALSLRNPWIQQMAQYKTPEELDRNFVKKYIEQVTVTLLDDGQAEISLTMKTDEWKQMLSRIEVEGTDSGTKE